MNQRLIDAVMAAIDTGGNMLEAVMSEFGFEVEALDAIQDLIDSVE